MGARYYEINDEFIEHIKKVKRFAMRQVYNDKCLINEQKEVAPCLYILEYIDNPQQTIKLINDEFALLEMWQFIGILDSHYIKDFSIKKPNVEVKYTKKYSSTVLSFFFDRLQRVCYLLYRFLFLVFPVCFFMIIVYPFVFIPAYLFIFFSLWWHFLRKSFTIIEPIQLLPNTTIYAIFLNLLIISPYNFAYNSIYKFLSFFLSYKNSTSSMGDSSQQALSIYLTYLKQVVTSP